MGDELSEAVEQLNIEGEDATPAPLVDLPFEILNYIADHADVLRNIMYWSNAAAHKKRIIDSQLATDNSFAAQARLQDTPLYAEYNHYLDVKNTYAAIYKTILQIRYRRPR